MKFYIVENIEVDKYRPITKRDAQKLLDTTHSQATKVQAIYRGLPTTESYLYYKDNPELPRRSWHIETNYYNMIINNHPAWEDFPKRSLIASFDVEAAYEYGDVYRVYPENGAKIGICPQPDIWNSGFADFNDDVAKLLEELRERVSWFDRNTYQKINYNWGAFVKICNDVDKIKEQAFAKNDPNIMPIFNNFASGFGKDHKDKFLLYLVRNLYSPIGNYIKPQDIFISTNIREMAKNGEKYKSNEVWTDAPCVLIRE